MIDVSFVFVCNSDKGPPFISRTVTNIELSNEEKGESNLSNKPLRPPFRRREEEKKEQVIHKRP
jgi:hypothetical protein